MKPKAIANGFPNILIIISESSEDISSVIIINVLSRTKKVNIFIATVNGSSQICVSQKTKIMSDCTIESIADENFDIICIPGGMLSTVINLWIIFVLVSFPLKHNLKLMMKYRIIF